MTNKEIIEQFYTSFVNRDAKKMTSCYHKDITFIDPVFGELNGIQAVKMWEMLLSRKAESTKISFKNIKTSKKKGSAEWTAKYVYGEKKRKVVNKVTAKFKFKDGKIIKHVDTFNLWKWTQQALGPAGYILGWSPFMKSKIQRTTNMQLNEYMNKN